MKSAFILIFILNFSIMSAQEEKPRDINNPILLSENLSIYQETETKDGFIHWKLYLKKEGEKDTKTLEDNRIRVNIQKEDDSALDNFAKLLNKENYMLYPQLINAYKEGKYIYVFLYKDRRAMLDIYYFSDGVNFERTGYSLHHMGGASVMNFGLYAYSIDIQEIGNSHYISYIAARALVDRGSKGILRIKDGDVSKIEIKEDSEKTIFYPYRIKDIEGKEVSRKEKGKIFHQELMKQLEEKNLLVRKDFLETYGYINERTNDMVYYIFYKTSNTEKTMKLAKYGNYFINHKPKFWMMFADYIEQPLLPEYSRWNPKK